MKVEIQDTITMAQVVIGTIPQSAKTLIEKAAPDYIDATACGDSIYGISSLEEAITLAEEGIISKEAGEDAEEAKAYLNSLMSQVNDAGHCYVQFIN